MAALLLLYEIEREQQRQRQSHHSRQVHSSSCEESRHSNRPITQSQKKDKDKVVSTAARMASSLEQTRPCSLQCPICHRLLTEPKLLSCAHTFCKHCLALLHFSQGQKENVICPVCQTNTHISGGNVQDLQTNVHVKSLVNDVGDKWHCTVCEKEKKVPSTSFCEECNTYMCELCEQKHNEWKLLSKHRVVKLEDVREGMVALKKSLLCQGHSPLDKDELVCTDVCIDCKKSICLRCRMLDHEKKHHKVMSTAEFARAQKAELEDLQQQARSQIEVLKRKTDIVNSQLQEVDPQYDNMIQDVKSAHKKGLDILRLNKQKLLAQCVLARTQRIGELQACKSASENMVSRIESISTLASNSGKVITIESTAVRKHLSSQLKAAMKYATETKINHNHQHLDFKSYLGCGSLQLGAIMSIEWQCREVRLPAKRSISCLAGTPDGKMAVGSQNGIHLFSDKGKPQQTLMNNKQITGLDILSDGRLVVCDERNILSIYTGHQCQRMEVSFETLPRDEGESCSIAVGIGDCIFVCYKKAKQIQVFTTAGGKAIRNIPCDANPVSICAPKYSTSVVVGCCSNEVRVINQSGVVEASVSEPGDYSAEPAIGPDGSVFIAWVQGKLGLLRIVQYSFPRLEEMETIIDLHEIKHRTPNQSMYNLRLFKNGSMAFASPQMLYILHKCTVNANVTENLGSATTR